MLSLIFCPSLPVKLEVKINSGEGYLLHLNVNHEWKIGRYQNKGFIDEESFL